MTEKLLYNIEWEVLKTQHMIISKFLKNRICFPRQLGTLIFILLTLCKFPLLFLYLRDISLPVSR